MEKGEELFRVAEDLGTVPRKGGRGESSPLAFA